MFYKINTRKETDFQIMMKSITLDGKEPITDQNQYPYYFSKYDCREDIRDNLIQVLDLKENQMLYR